MGTDKIDTFRVYVELTCEHFDERDRGIEAAEEEDDEKLAKVSLSISIHKKWFEIIL